MAWQCSFEDVLAESPCHLTPSPKPLLPTSCGIKTLLKIQKIGRPRGVEKARPAPGFAAIPPPVMHIYIYIYIYICIYPVCWIMKKTFVNGSYDNPTANDEE
jgi:hypothetical protein